jgi:hypothetical protein
VPIVAVNLDDIVKGELHENIVRRDFTFTERQAILREVENRRIGHRVSGQKVDNLSSFQQENRGQSSAEIVAKYTGKSLTQIKKEKKLLETLQGNPNLNYLVEQLDQEDITVNHAYKIVGEAENRPDGRHIHDGIFYCNYLVGWSDDEGIIHCLLCLIDEAYPDEYAPKDTIIPVIYTNEDWSRHFINYHVETGRVGNVMAEYVPHLGDKMYEPDSWWWKEKERKFREERKKKRMSKTGKRECQKQEIDNQLTPRQRENIMRKG